MYTLYIYMCRHYIYTKSYIDRCQIYAFCTRLRYSSYMCIYIYMYTHTVYVEAFVSIPTLTTLIMNIKAEIVSNHGKPAGTCTNRW